MNVRAEIQFGGEEHVATSVACEEGDFAVFEFAGDVGVGRVAEGCGQTDFLHVGEAGHGVEATASYDSDFCLWQRGSWGELCIIAVTEWLLRSSQRGRAQDGQG